MRIRKAPRHDSLIVTTPSPSSLTAHERLLWKDVDELITSSDHELASQLFVLHVMKPLLGSKFVDAGVCLLIQLPITTFMLIY
jgi:inositol-pentakisphosphate 2-kinase